MLLMYTMRYFVEVLFRSDESSQSPSESCRNRRCFSWRSAWRWGLARSWRRLGVQALGCSLGRKGWKNKGAGPRNEMGNKFSFFFPPRALCPFLIFSCPVSPTNASDWLPPPGFSGFLHAFCSYWVFTAYHFGEVKDD